MVNDNQFVEPHYIFFILIEKERESTIKARIKNPSNQDNLIQQKQKKNTKPAGCLISLQIRCINFHSNILLGIYKFHPQNKQKNR